MDDQIDNFERWLDQEYTVAKLTLLSGQSNGKKLTPEEIDSLRVEFNTLERVYNKFIETDVFGSLLDKVEQIETPFKSLSIQTGRDMDFVTTNFAHTEKLEWLSHSYQVDLKPQHVTIEQIKHSIRHYYRDQLARIRAEIESLYKYIPK